MLNAVSILAEEQHAGLSYSDRKKSKNTYLKHPSNSKEVTSFVMHLWRSPWTLKHIEFTSYILMKHKLRLNIVEFLKVVFIYHIRYPLYFYTVKCLGYEDVSLKRGHVNTYDINI